MRRLTLIMSLALIVSCAAVFFAYFSPVSKAQDGNERQTQKFQYVTRGPGKRMAVDKEGIQRLKNRTGGAAQVKTSEGTGAARFVNVGQSRSGDLANLGKSVSDREKSATFFDEYGSLFGINKSDVEMRFENEKVDAQGIKHQVYKQFYKGVPVFAGVLKTHFNKDNDLYAVNGTSVPVIDVDATPTINAQEAAATAAALVADQKGVRSLTAKNANLYVYRTGLVENVPGDDYLVYEIEVTNNLDIREFVYIDAHSNKIVEQFTGITDGLDRRAYNGNFLAQNQISTFYPNTTFWVEGQAFPTGNAEADNMITSSKETYDLYKNAFGRDSLNGLGIKMDSIFNRGYSCPNASWNGTFISFCNGLTVDDVTAHEWSHAYTQYTHGLIYAFQPGALNESYSDIFGETVDRINERDNIGNSGTDPMRTADSCSTYSPTSPRFFVNAPASIAGPYSIGRANFGPGYTPTGVTGNVVAAQDAANAAGPSTTDGCSALTNAAAVAGNVALIDRGTCGFEAKVVNAQNAGAIGVIIGNIASSANPNSTTNMADDPTLTATIVAVHVPLNTNNTFKAQLSNGLNVTIKSTNNADASTRWLLGEDSTATGLTGALRDMYNPTCYSNPGKVSDTLYYTCDSYPGSDNGGVHTNSGVPNHAYALLVDGGTYNGQTVQGIGLTKAAHIYFRAESVYQVANSNFIDHADSVEQAALDLMNSGANLADLKTGLPSGEVVNANDLAQVKKAMLAVEMRKSPAHCGVATILGKNPPSDATFTVPKTFLSEDFETGASGWTMSSEFGGAGAVVRDWVITKAPERAGVAAYISDPNYSCSASAPNQTGVMHLESPAFQIPNDAYGLKLSFDHRVATEFGYDGGQLMVSVDGGSFTQVANTSFIYNTYNTTFLSSPQSSNPRAGQKAFSGTDDKQNLLEGSWGKSIVDLTGMEGHTVKFRWDFSNDNCGGQNIAGYGWFVDNIKVLGGLIDTDQDGVADSVDNCPYTNTAQAYVIVGTNKFSNTGVPNKILSSGCSLQQKIDASKVGVKNHGGYVSAVSNLTDQWVAQGIITAAQQDAIMRAVAQDK